MRERCIAGEARARVSLAVVALLMGLGGCSRDEQRAATSAPSASARAGVAQLTPELRARVLVEVGKRKITLGDYADVLARMDRFDRMRYQTLDRRKQLLEEMIDVELLAVEAERRGLDREAETQALFRQLLRDEMIERLRQDLPALDEIGGREIRKYYEAHRDEFREPERRRVAAIVVDSLELARRLAKDAQGADGARWGELVAEHARAKTGARAATPRLADGTDTAPPPELAGDLGFVTAPGVREDVPSEVPDAVRAAAFAITELGGVHPEPVSVDAQHYVLRLISKSEARDRTLSEADRTLRVKVLQERLRAAEQRLERELRGKYEVQIDEAALAELAASLGGPQAAGSAPAGSTRGIPKAP